MSKKQSWIRRPAVILSFVAGTAAGLGGQAVLERVNPVHQHLGCGYEIHAPASMVEPPREKDVGCLRLNRLTGSWEFYWADPNYAARLDDPENPPDSISPEIVIQRIRQPTEVRDESRPVPPVP